MKKSIVSYPLLLVLTTLLVFTSSCSDQDDNVTTVASNLQVQDFIWKGMNTFYFWQESVPDLADDRFSTNEEYAEYLSQFTDPRAFFEDELLVTEDRFSFITDDYNDLIAIQTGEFRTNGVEFGLVQISGTNDVFGYVRYILPNSNASSQNIDRGDVFYAVDGQQITVSNFESLLFGANDSYTLNMADLVSGVVTPNGNSVSLTKAAYTENPVFISQTLDVGGQKIGYLMYNGFTPAFDAQLNDAFAAFQAENITDLVLDVRYNPGGSVGSASRLASMITGQFNGQLFLKERWNNKIQEIFESQNPDAIVNNFVNTLSNGTAINSLNLGRVYVLTTRSSASASEAIINGLTPYINVVQIGATTRGKNEFSITLVDDPGNAYVYSPSRINNINDSHTWGMQPLTGRIENADGFYDYTSGLAPDTVLAEDLENLGTLGDVTEPLLAEALSQITGVGRGARFVQMPIEDMTGSHKAKPNHNKMHVEKIIDIPLQFDVNIEE